MDWVWIQDWVGDGTGHWEFGIRDQRLKIRIGDWGLEMGIGIGDGGLGLGIGIWNWGL